MTNLMYTHGIPGNDKAKAIADLHNHRVRVEYRHASLAGTFVAEGVLVTRTVALDSVRTSQQVLISPDGTLGAATYSLSTRSIVGIDDLGSAASTAA